MSIISDVSWRSLSDGDNRQAQLFIQILAFHDFDFLSEAMSPSNWADIAANKRKTSANKIPKDKIPDESERNVCSIPKASGLLTENEVMNRKLVWLILFNA